MFAGLINASFKEPNMLADVVMYLFLALINGGEGPKGIVSSTMEECQESYDMAKGMEEVLAVSECQEVTLKKR